MIKDCDKLGLIKDIKIEMKTAVAWFRSAWTDAANEDGEKWAKYWVSEMSGAISGHDRKRWSMSEWQSGRPASGNGAGSVSYKIGFNAERQNSRSRSAHAPFTRSDCNTSNKYTHNFVFNLW